MSENIFQTPKDKNNKMLDPDDNVDNNLLIKDVHEDVSVFIEEDGYPAPYRNVLENFKRKENRFRVIVAMQSWR